MMSAPDENCVSSGCPRIPDHRLVRPIGRGAAGEVWLARSLTGVWRAVKVVRQIDFEESRPLERELAALRACQEITRSTPQLAPILHVGRDEQEGFLFYIMELADDADGADPLVPATYRPRSLRLELKRRGRLPVKECFVLGRALAEGLSALHRAGLVHRDVKPGNILYFQGQPRLADVGLVTRTDLSVSFAGTEGYMPPDGLGKPSADFYNLGMVLYESGSGRSRHDFPRLPEDLERMEDRLPWRELNLVVLRACSPRISKRYASAESFLADLERAESGVLSRRRFSKAALAAAAVLSVALVFLAVWAWTRPSLLDSPARPGAAQTLTAPVPAAVEVGPDHFLSQGLSLSRPVMLAASTNLAILILNPGETLDFQFVTPGTVRPGASEFVEMEIASPAPPSPNWRATAVTEDGRSLPPEVKAGRAGNVRLRWSGSRVVRVSLSGHETGGAIRQIRFLPPVEAPEAQSRYLSPRLNVLRGFDSNQRTAWLEEMVPPRPPGASRNQLDLTGFYNASLDHSTVPAPTDWEAANNGFPGLPRGLVRFGTQSFDLRGAIQLDGLIARQRFDRVLPEQVTGIPAGLAFHTLHLLGFTHWGSEPEAVALWIELRFEDGGSERLPVHFGLELDGSWQLPGRALEDLPRGRLAWSGSNPMARNWPVTLWQTALSNPRPDKVVTHLSLVSALTAAAPCVVALTVE